MEEIAFAEGDTRSFESLLKTQMQAPIKHFEKELASIRVGRASIDLVSDIKIESYGNMSPLKQLATISTPDAHLITIQPWDKSIINEIEKTIRNSDLGVTPVNDGNIIRLQLPQMSSARREELVKQLGKKTEECRIGIRNVRKDFHNEVRDAVKKKIISEDFGKKLMDLLQKITDSFIGQADSAYEKKAKSVREI